MKRLFYLLFGLVLLPALLYAQGSLSLKDINDNLTNNYYTKTVSDGKYASSVDVAAKADKTYVDANFATTAENALKQNISDMVDYYTKTAADLLLADKADTDSVYTITAADLLFAAKANSADVYTTAEIQADYATTTSVALKASQIDMDSAEAVIQNILVDDDSQDVTIEAVRVKADSNETAILADMLNLANNYWSSATAKAYVDGTDENIINVLLALKADLTYVNATDENIINTLIPAKADLTYVNATDEIIMLDDDSQDVQIEANKVGVASLEVGLQTHQNNPTGAHAATAISATWTNVQVSLDSIEAAIQGIVVGSGFALESWVNSTLETNFFTQAQTNATIEAAIAAIPAGGGTAIEDIGTYIESNTTWEFDTDYDTTAVCIYRNRIYQPRSLFTTVDVSSKTRVVFNSAINASDEIILISNK